MAGARWALLLLLVFPARAACGDPDPLSDDSCTAETERWWVNGGVGSASGDIGSGPLLSAGLSWSSQSGSTLLSLRTVYTAEVEFHIFGEAGAPAESAWDAGVLYGWILRRRLWCASAGAGAGFVGGRRVTGSFLTLGIPAESQLFLTPLSWLGVGVYWFANLNTERSFWGGLFALQIRKP
ncbi:MAG: hypothetical protein WB626_08230 [Bacteroidota bacterium]